MKWPCKSWFEVEHFKPVKRGLVHEIVAEVHVWECVHFLIGGVDALVKSVDVHVFKPVVESVTTNVGFLINCIVETN